MKTNRMFLLLSVAATLLCTACSSDDDPLVSAAADDATTTATEWKTIHYEATVSDGSSTRATLDDENKYIFESGDKLIVAGENIKGELALKSGDEGKHTGATFEGDLEYTGSAPTAETSLTATLVSSADAIHTVSGKAITATSYATTLCTTRAEAIQKLSNFTATSTYGAKSFSLSQKTAFLDFTVTMDDGTANGTSVAVSIKNNGSEIVSGNVSTTKPGDAVIAHFIAGIADGTTLTSATVQLDSRTALSIVASKEFSANKFYNVARTQVPTGAIGGKFTINSSGDKVYFSKGNLQYQASSKTWRFAENQYDYVGDATKGNVKVEETKSNNASISSSYTGWIDLFGWGTSNRTIANYGSAYQPWSTSTTSTHYGPTGAYNLTGTYANGDWGVNMGTGWRTLTGGSGGEWEYLFGTKSSNKRTTTSGILYAKATVNGVAGVILLPDDWSASYHSLTSYNTTDAAYTANSITDTDWSNDFEAHGAVFLPAAGRRSGTPVGDVGSIGYYWSSTALGTDNAYYVFFGSGNVRPENSSSRYYGYSVRLVRLVV